MEIHTAADSAFYHFRVPANQNSDVLALLFTLYLDRLDPYKIFKRAY